MTSLRRSPVRPGRAAGGSLRFREIWGRFLAWMGLRPASTRPGPEHLRRGRMGERAARRYLRRVGLKVLTVNFRSARGELDLVCRDRDCLVIVEVKTRSSEDWGRPAAAVKKRKQRRLTRATFDYLDQLHRPSLKLRFDIVEVLLEDGAVREIRHLPNAFPLTPPYRYG